VLAGSISRALAVVGSTSVHAPRTSRMIASVARPATTTAPRVATAMVRSDTLPSLPKAATIAEVEQRLSAMIEEARAAVPELSFEDADLTAWIRERIPAEGDAEAQLATMRAPELLIAMKCAKGERAAIELFERRCFEEVGFAHARIKPKVTVDEAKQMMRERLFVAKKIELYGGTGDLRGWFRVTVVRQLLNVATRAPKETTLEDRMLEALPKAADDPELEHARRLYTPVVTEALTEGIARLERRDRALLRLAVCDGLGIDAIGELYGVHRATAARWIAGAREKLEANVKEILRGRLRAGEESLASVLRLVGSHVEISLRGHLAASQSL
jgi:RNA polymerase sigma-70 factor (ECF subfamily)